MPTGMVIMKWDDRTGVEIVSTFPKEVSIQERTLMQIYAQHEFTGEAGMVSLAAGVINIASYFTGPETMTYILLLLTAEEDPDIYEEGLADMAQQVIKEMETGNLDDLLPLLFQRLSVYPTMKREQKLASVFANDMKRQIFMRIREEVVVAKSELAVWLKDMNRDGFMDVTDLISPLVKEGLVKIGSVKGIATDMLFLTQDLSMMRTPPVELIKDPVDHHLPSSMKESYIQEVRNFFSSYQPTLKDSLQIMKEILLDPECYPVLELLREAMVTRNDLEKLRKKGVENLDRVLKLFWKTQMVSVFQDDKGNEYYCLICDFKIDPFYPHHAIDKIRGQYRNKAQNNSTLLVALDTLREEYKQRVKSS